MPQYNFELSTEPEKFKELLINIQSYFSNETQSIHQARNTLKVISYERQEVVIKSFEVLSPLRRFFYTHFRDSKAKRSYLHARKLVALDIGTPSPIGYIEFFRNGKLYDSYYVAKKVDYDYTIREALNKPEGRFIAALESSAEFAAKLHNAGILHYDFSPGNLLITECDGEFHCELVDLNRMKFGPIDTLTGLNNLVRMMEQSSSREIFLRAYAKHRNLDPETSLKTLNKLADKYRSRRKIKKKFKNALKHFLKR